MRKKFKLLILAAFLFSVFSCSYMKTNKDQFVGLDEKLQIRDYKTAIAQLEAAKETGYKKKDRVVYYLDLGMLYHFDGQYEKSNEYLENAERAIEELFTKSILKTASTFLVNDNLNDYPGEDYEDIYLNVFKALNYLQMNQFDEAFVEIRRVNHKLNLLNDKYGGLVNALNSVPSNKIKIKSGKTKFHNSALARYLSLLIYQAEQKFDDARIDHQKLLEAFKSQSQIYNFATPEISYNKPKKAKVNVICFAGRGPDKRQKTLYIHTEKDLLFIGASNEWNDGQNKADFDIIQWPGVKDGYHFKFQLPFLENRNSMISKVRIVVNDEVESELHLLESFDNVALATYQVKAPIIYLKTIARSIVKGVVAHDQKRKMKKAVGGGLGGQLLELAADYAVDQTENADLRLCRFLPKKALIGELELAAGQYNIKLEYLSSNGNVLWVDDKGMVNVGEDGLNLIESYYLW